MSADTRPILKTYRHPWLARRSYQILDPRSGMTAVVDPIHEVDAYLEDAAALGCRVAHVFLTRLHPGYETGHVLLRDRALAAIHIGAWARPDYGVTPLKDGDVVEFGDVRLRILETPGRSLEAISILFFDLTADARSPLAVLTGDTLLIGDVGFPDVPADGRLTCRELAGMLYGSLRGKLLRLPGGTRVYPGHDTAAPCGPAEESGGLWSTLERQKVFNHALQPMTRSAFAHLVCAEKPDTDDGAEKPAVGPSVLSLDEFLRRRSDGAQALDVRGQADYAGAHLEGSLHIGLAGPFGDWAGALLDSRRAVVVIAEPGREAEAARRLKKLRIPLSGFLRRGMEAFEKRPELLRRTPRLTATQLAVELASDRPPRILDVRSGRERRARRIDGSLHIPLDELIPRRSELPRGERLVIACSTGYRATIAASLLECEGVDDVSVLIGGLAAWELRCLT